MAKLTTAIQIRYNPDELAELDAFARDIARHTGEQPPRTELIRQAVRDTLALREWQGQIIPHATTRQPTRPAQHPARSRP